MKKQNKNSIATPLLRQKAEEKVKLKYANKSILTSEIDILKLIHEFEVHQIELEMQNEELDFQNEEKEKRAEELIIANKELTFQNQEKESRAQELIVANKELAFQNQEKEKRAQELIVANKELAFQNEEKERRAVELTIANKNLEQFVYIASHDLQEPLRTISNYIQVLEEDYLALFDDNAREYLLVIKDASKRMSILISSFLDFSQLGRNINLKEVDCNNLIAEVITDLKMIIKTSNAVIEVTEMPKLNLYEHEIRQLFQNLILNAIQFQKKDSQPNIQIRSERINEKWKFSVTDNGIGIATAHFEKIFEIFQRLNSNADYKGIGIGLANCKKIVQMHQGEIWVESNLGKGTTFNFTIPNIT